jgi:hypothetical protein
MDLTNILSSIHLDLGYLYWLFHADSEQKSSQEAGVFLSPPGAEFDFHRDIMFGGQGKVSDRMTLVHCDRVSKF